MARENRSDETDMLRDTGRAEDDKAPTHWKRQHKGDVKVHFAVGTRLLVAVSTPGLLSKHQDPLIVTVSASFHVSLKVKCSRMK